MKNKLVLWGSNAQNEKVLIAMELRPEQNKVDIWTFSEAVATEDFTNQMFNEWRTGAGEVVFPEARTHIERELTVSENLLPDDLKVERGDIIHRAQTEWHFIVLSSKLSQAYKAELEDLKDRIDKMTTYSGDMWDTLKTFWDKVQEQVRDRNLFREHADSLRDGTNELFTRLKDLRTQLDDDFQRNSKAHLDKFMTMLGDVETKVASKARIPAIFDELKNLQRQFRETPFTKEHRSQVWERLDNAFKNVKEIRFGPAVTDESNASPTERIQRRYDGLMSAIGKMQESIDRDKEDLVFQNKKIATTDGQLEAQIRKAKIMMIEERVRSKEDKLNEMLQTKAELLKSMDIQKEKDARRAEREKLDVAKKIAQDKIAGEIKQAAAARVGDEKIEKAVTAVVPEIVTPVTAVTTAVAATITEDVPAVVSSTVSAVTEPVVTAVDNVVTTVTKDIPDAVSSTVSKISEKVETAVEPTVSNVMETVSSTVSSAIETVGNKLDEIIPKSDEGLTFTERVEETVEDTVDTVKAVASVVGEKVENFMEELMGMAKDDTPKKEDKD